MENSTNKNYNVIIYNVIRKLGLRPNHLGTVLISKAVPLIKEKAHESLIIQVDGGRSVRKKLRHLLSPFKGQLCNVMSAHSSWSDCKNSGHRYG